jgi:hypothetical protein
VTQQSAGQTPTDDRADVLVLKDGEGNYYAISGRQLAGHRVPDENKAEFETLMSGAEVVGFQGPGLTSAPVLPVGLGVATTFSAQVVQLPSLPRALMQGPSPRGLR